MAPTNVSGTLTTTVGSQHFVYSQTDAATTQFFIDTVNMQNGDVLEVRSHYLVGGSSRVLDYYLYSGMQSPNDYIKALPPIGAGAGNEVSISVRQVAGTSRSFPWKVVNYG